MGKQRAHRKREFWSKLYRQELDKVAETGFRTPIMARMGVPIIARQAKMVCRCGRTYLNNSSFSDICAYVCGQCGCVFRVVHGFNRREFENRPNPKMADWWQFAEAIQLERVPDPEDFNVPYRILGQREFACRIGSRNSPGVHFDLGQQKMVIEKKDEHPDFTKH